MHIIYYTAFFGKLQVLSAKFGGKMYRKRIFLVILEKIFRIAGEKFSENSLKTIEKKVVFVYTVL